MALVAKEIERQGLPEQLGNISFVFTGTGNVSTGAQEIFQLLGPTMVRPKDFAAAAGDKRHPGRLVGTVLEYKDFQGSQGASEFAQRFAPHTNVLVNGVYWDDGLPRLLSKAEMRALAAAEGSGLVAIADISCDIDGGIEFTSKATTIDEPFMYYDPLAMSTGSRASCSKCVQLMTIDNLPAQLPRDASEFFSATLSAILKAHLKAKGPTEVVRRATIVHKGELAGRFGHLKSSETAAPRNVLVLGSGYVSKPTVDYLARHAHAHVLVASNAVADARRIVSGVPNAKAVALDVGRQADVEKLVRAADIVISLLPAAMHPAIADHCIANGKSLVTGSYISPAMGELAPAAKNITILNEIGLDPGLDHLSAMKMIDGVRSQGDRVDSFVSWCGGLPAPECADNPFGYKFSWRPQGVLLATQNPAQYLLRGKVVNVQGSGLLKSAMPIKIHPAFAFEGLPNRNSLSYIPQYGLEGVHTMFRGTLRYRGFSELMDSCAKIGLLSTEPLGKPLLHAPSWLQAVEALVPHTEGSTLASFAQALGSPSMTARAQRLLAALEWLGAMSKDEAFRPAASMLDAFSALLEKKLVFRAGERDMAFMFHEVQVTSRGGKKERLTSTMVEYGDPHGYSAMAKTVGLPVAVAAELLLNDKIRERGVIAPLSSEFYGPMLPRLEKEGIRFHETRSPLA